MSDIEILHSGETMVNHVSGETDAGIEFVDAYMPTSHPLAGLDIQVIDSGRIVLPDAATDEFVSACQKEGLTVEQREGV